MRTSGIHVDPQRATAAPFGATIAHGYLSLALLAAFSRQVIAGEGEPKPTVRAHPVFW